jgi:hypothetical protein
VIVLTITFGALSPPKAQIYYHQFAFGNLMKKAQFLNYLNLLSRGANADLKPICMHGTGNVLNEIHIVLKKSLKGKFVESIEKLLGNSSRTYFYWRRNEKPIPIIKARRLVLLWHSLTGARKSEKDEIWDGFYDACSGFSVNSGKFVLLPKSMSSDLAYLVGVVFGDGCIYAHTKGKLGLKSRYSMQITDESKEFLQHVVLPKLGKVFGIESAILRKGNGNWYVLIVHSKVLYVFLKNVVKMPAGKKKGKLVIPLLIKRCPTATAAFLRGLFDTDGWISKISTVKPSLGLSQSDDRFLKDVKEMLSELGILVGGPYSSGSRKGHELRSFSLRTIREFDRAIGFEHPLKKQRLLHFIPA